MSGGGNLDETHALLIGKQAVGFGVYGQRRFGGKGGQEGGQLVGVGNPMGWGQGHGAIILLCGLGPAGPPS